MSTPFSMSSYWPILLQEIAGHKLSDAVIDRLPTLCTLSPEQRISYSEVAAFHNVIKGKPSLPLRLF